MQQDKHSGIVGIVKDSSVNEHGQVAQLNLKSQRSPKFKMGFSIKYLYQP